jgi:hypothetical protein
MEGRRFLSTVGSLPRKNTAVKMVLARLVADADQESSREEITRQSAAHQGVHLRSEKLGEIGGAGHGGRAPSTGTV